MNAELPSLRRLSESQYADIGRTLQLLSTIEYEIFRVLAAAFGTEAKDSIDTAARATFNQRKQMLSTKLKGDQRIRPEQFEDTLKKLETASELRDQFVHGLWVVHREQLICKYITRHRGVDGTNGVALKKIAMPPEKFTFIQRKLEYVLVELDVILELLNDD